MKLLSWMRTIKQNGLIPSKEFNGGFGCLRAQVFSDVHDIRTNSFSFSGSSHDQSPPPKVKEELLFDEDGFCGFLAIGTLGTDPETPKFSALVAEENVTGEEKEMAKLVTEKLENFLEEQAEDTSYSSTQIERLDAKGDGEFNVCPPQGHDLFRSSIELTKRSNGEVKKKKGLLTSLFKRRQTVQGESYIEKHGTRDVIKKVFEKLHGASSKTRNDDDSMPKKKDLRKSAQICRSKVHPILHTPERDHVLYTPARDPILYTPARDDNEIDNRGKLDLGSSPIAEANRKKENWIKTDMEYLVLEL